MEDKKIIFIDLGAYQGDSVQKAIDKYPQLDRVYAFEPFESSFRELEKKFEDNSKVVLFNKAVSTRDCSRDRLYHSKYDDLGGSLSEEKDNCHKEKYSHVESVDISNFIKTNFNKDKHFVILKIDIEGTEYEILEKMINDDSISCISKIYCEWHYDRIGLSKRKHGQLVKKLKNLGFDLTGKNKHDEFMYIPIPFKTEMVRYLIKILIRLKIKKPK